MILMLISTLLAIVFVNGHLNSWKIVRCLRWNGNYISTKIPAGRTDLANSSKEGACRTHERPACSQQEDLESNMCVCECKH